MRFIICDYETLVSGIRYFLFITRTDVAAEKLTNKSGLWNKVLSENIRPSTAKSMHMLLLEGVPELKITVIGITGLGGVTSVLRDICQT